MGDTRMAGKPTVVHLINREKKHLHSYIGNGRVTLKDGAGAEFVDVADEDFGRYKDDGYQIFMTQIGMDDVGCCSSAIRPEKWAVDRYKREAGIA